MFSKTNVPFRDISKDNLYKIAFDICIGCDYAACVDYMDLAVRCPQKGS